MDYKFVEKNESNGAQKICFLKKDDIVGIETGKMPSTSRVPTDPSLFEVIYIYTRSMPLLTLIFDDAEKRDQFLQELTEDFNPKEFAISWKK